MATMREPTFWILTALAAGPLHGYGLIGEVTGLTDGRVRLQAGTLYAALDRLTAEGLIEPDRAETVDGRVRRYYRLTEFGALSLAEETARLRQNVTTATRRLAARRAGLGPAAVLPS